MFFIYCFLLSFLFLFLPFSSHSSFLIESISLLPFSGTQNDPQGLMCHLTPTQSNQLLGYETPVKNMIQP